MPRSSQSDQAAPTSEPSFFYRMGWPLFFAGVPFLGWSTPGLLLLIVDWVATRRRLKVGLPPTYRYTLVGLVVIFILTSTVSGHPLDSFGTALGFTLTLLFGADYCFRLARAGEGNRVLYRYLWPVPIAGALHALFGIYQYITTDARAAGTTVNPNYFGTLMVTAGFLGFLYLLSRRDWVRWLTVPYGPIILGGLLASGSRGSWVAAVAGLSVVGWLYLRDLYRKNSRRSLRLLAMGAIAAVLISGLAWQMASPLLRARVVSIFDMESNRDRITIYQTMGRLILANPWLGVGLNNLKYEYPRYRVENTTVNHGMAHNMVLQVLGETGILGLALTGLLLGIWVVRGFPSGKGTRALYWLYGLLIALLVRDQFDGALLNLNLAFLLNWLGATLTGCGLNRDISSCRLR